MGSCCAKIKIEEDIQETIPTYYNPYKTIFKQETNNYIISNSSHAIRRTPNQSPDNENIYISSDSSCSTPFGSY